MALEAIPCEPTTSLYLDDTALYSCKGVVTLVSSDLNEKGWSFVYVDSTVFHPQGGGQPADTGKIVGTSTTFTVLDTRATGEHRDRVCHWGIYSDGPFSVGERVELEIDAANRMAYARIHSAGHLLDVAVAQLLCEEEAEGHSYALSPGKGFHFPSGPYVEYNGVVPAGRRSHFTSRLETVMSELVGRNSVVRVTVVTPEGAAEGVEEDVKRLCGGKFPSYLAKNRPVRVVTLAGHEGCPCGGTHVKNTGDVGTVTIRKISCRKGKTRLSYSMM